MATPLLHSVYFFQHDNRDAPPRPRPPPHNAPPPNGEQGAVEGVGNEERGEGHPKDSRRPNTTRGREPDHGSRGAPDHWSRGAQVGGRRNSPEVWKHDLFDVFDHSPSPGGEEEDGEGSVQYRSVVQKVTGGGGGGEGGGGDGGDEGKWVHDKFETEIAGGKGEGRGADRGKWLHDKFEARGDREGRGPRRESSRWLHDKFEQSRGDHGGRRRRETNEGSPRGRVSDRLGKRDGNKVPSREEKTVPMETST